MARVPRWKVAGLALAAGLFAVGLVLGELEDRPPAQTAYLEAPPAECFSHVAPAEAGDAPCAASGGAPPPPP